MVRAECWRRRFSLKHNQYRTGDRSWPQSLCQSFWLGADLARMSFHLTILHQWNREECVCLRDIFLETDATIARTSGKRSPMSRAQDSAAG